MTDSHDQGFTWSVKDGITEARRDGQTYRRPATPAEVQLSEQFAEMVRIYDLAERENGALVGDLERVREALLEQEQRARAAALALVKLRGGLAGIQPAALRAVLISELRAVQETLDAPTVKVH